MFLLNGNIAKDIPLKAKDVADEIFKRQGMPFNDGRTNDYEDFPNIQELFKIINSGVKKQPWMYQGRLYRIHSAHPTTPYLVDKIKEEIIEEINDNECVVLPYTEYSEKLVAFSKNDDFTRKGLFNHKLDTERIAVIICADTKKYYGIDVNEFCKHFKNYKKQFANEEEVLFPLLKEFVTDEFKCTPEEFNQIKKTII